MGIQPGDSGVVVGYQVNEFTHTWSAEQSVMDNMSSLTHFSLEPGCEDYSFLDQAVDDFEQGLYSILTDSIKTQELDASFEKPDGVLSSVSSEILCLVSTISNTSKLQLAPSIKSHKFWQARHQYLS